MKMILQVVLCFLLTQIGYAENKPATIRVAGDEWFLRSLTKTGLLDSFERQNGIHVEVVLKNDRAIMNDLEHDKKDGEAPYDIIVVRHRLLGALVEEAEVQSIDSFLADSSLHDPRFSPQKRLFPKWWRELSSYQGHFYGYPFTALTTYLCYRKDLVEDPANQQRFKARYHRELGPPTSWKEYLQLAEFFNRPGEHFYGTYIQGKQGLALWYEWLNFVYSFGGGILDARHGWQYGDIIVNSPQNVAATELYVKLTPFSPPDTLTYGWNEAQSALQQGHVFMGLLWSDQAPLLEDPKVSKVAGKIGYALIPSATGKPFSQMEGLTYLIVSGSKHSKEAYRFLEWAMSDRVQVEQTLRGSSSVLKSTYDDGRVKNLPYTSAFLASVPVARPKPTISESDEMTKAMERHVADIVASRTSARQGLDVLALDIQQILGNKVHRKDDVRSEHR
jgi:multiple sugar transport system substrate-binding protein